MDSAIVFVCGENNFTALSAESGAALKAGGRLPPMSIFWYRCGCQDYP
jgi:hypothetical protein